MLIIDLMYNLFIGTAKRVLKNIWMSSDECLLSSTQIQSIQDRMDNRYVPSDTGRIPRKIETKFSGFTADQYKNWVTLYSIPSLHGVLESEHLERWRHFVIACRLLCKCSISESDVTVADALLLQFCRRVERMYGKTAIIPNMHMQCHLKNIILDYGPVMHSGSFHMNVTMASWNTNQQVIERVDSFMTIFPKQFSLQTISMMTCAFLDQL